MNFHKSIVSILTLAIIPSSILYLLILYISVKAGIDPILVLRDPIQACDYPTNVGMISNIGVLMWASYSEPHLARIPEESTSSWRITLWNSMRR